jgi:DNA-binding SARP family transcriptional activator
MSGNAWEWCIDVYGNYRMTHGGDYSDGAADLWVGLFNEIYPTSRCGFGAISFSASGSFNELVRLCLGKTIQRKCDEGYQALLDLYINSGNDEAYFVRYREYQRLLRREWGEKPAPVYLQHYQALIKEALKNQGEN